MIDEFFFIGRKIYFFTRPDGTYVVEKPKCCRRIFPETEDINTRPTFFKQKTWNTDEKLWNDYRNGTQTKTQQNALVEDEQIQYESIESTIQNVDDILLPLDSQ